MDSKATVLLIGSGGVGTIAALNLESGGLAQVTAVLRSNYEAVREKGFTIRSADHGTLSKWRPSRSKALVIGQSSLPSKIVTYCP
jgi:ketopantoate reductase